MSEGITHFKIVISKIIFKNMTKTVNVNYYETITFVVLALLLILPGDFINLTLTLNLGVVRFSLIDLFLLVFSFKAIKYYFSRNSVDVFNARFKEYFSVVLFILFYGTITSFAHGINFKFYGLEIRYFLGIFGGLGFSLFLRNIEIKRRFYFLGGLSMLLLTVSLVYHVLEGKVVLDESVLRGDLTYRATTIQAFSIYFISLILSPYLFTIQSFNKRISIVFPLIIVVQIIAFFFHGIRTFLIITIITWIMFFITNITFKKLVLFTTLLLLVVIIIKSTLSFFENTDYYYIVNSSMNRLENSYDSFSQSSRVSGTESRLDELFKTINNLNLEDFILGKGIGGVVKDQVGWSQSGEVNGIHIAIFNWVIKFGIVGILIVMWFFNETYKLYKEEKFISRNSYINLYSYIALVIWLLVQFISGGWDRWLFFFIFIMLLRDNSKINKNYA